MEWGTITVVLGVIGGTVALVLLAGLVAGQFRRGVVEELRQSLHTANTEIEIERKRSDRLEAEAQALRAEVIALRTEVETLRSVLTDDRALARTIAAELQIVHAEEVESIKESIGQGVARVIEVIQAAESHRP